MERIIRPLACTFKEKYLTSWMEDEDYRKMSAEYDYVAAGRIEEGDFLVVFRSYEAGGVESLEPVQPRHICKDANAFHCVLVPKA